MKSIFKISLKLLAGILCTASIAHADTTVFSNTHCYKKSIQWAVESFKKNPSENSNSAYLKHPLKTNILESIEHNYDNSYKIGLRVKRSAKVVYRNVIVNLNVHTNTYRVFLDNVGSVYDVELTHYNCLSPKTKHQVRKLCGFKKSCTLPVDDDGSNPS